MLCSSYELFGDVTFQRQENGKRGEEVGDAALQEHEGLRQGAQVDGRTRWRQGDYDVTGHQQA